MESITSVIFTELVVKTFSSPARASQGSIRCSLRFESYYTIAVPRGYISCGGCWGSGEEWRTMERPTVDDTELHGVNGRSTAVPLWNRFSVTRENSREKARLMIPAIITARRILAQLKTVSRRLLLGEVYVIHERRDFVPEGILYSRYVRLINTASLDSVKYSTYGLKSSIHTLGALGWQCLNDEFFVK